MFDVASFKLANNSSALNSSFGSEPFIITMCKLKLFIIFKQLIMRVNAFTSMATTDKVSLSKDDSIGAALGKLLLIS